MLLGQGAAAVPVAPYFNGVFPAVSPEETSWTTVNAFPSLSFTDPIFLTEVPGTAELLVIEKVGRISRFPRRADAGPDEVTKVLDLSASLQVSEDQGLYSLAFHPEFGRPDSPHGDEVFLCYSARLNPAVSSPDNSLWRLSRFRWLAASGTIDPPSESILIQQYDPHRWHNGGALAFDNDGCLLVTCGDGGGANDPYAAAQKLNGGLFAGVLRIDVDNDPSRSHPIRRQLQASSSFTRGYGIPDDNPWLSQTGSVLEEFYALGLRSPHSMSYDRQSGEIWVGDVGQNAQEELNLIQKGGNYQWPFMEGTASGPKFRQSFTIHGGEVPPVHAYDRTVGGCIIGGIRYRGTLWAAQLGGKILFGDNIRGTISAYTPDPPDGPPSAVPIVTGFGAGIYTGLSHLATDSAGEVYCLRLAGQQKPGGTIRKLATAPASVQPPALLSGTGLFTDTASLTPAAALMAYDVASPLWSDGAVKKRWIAVPNDGTRDSSSEKITFSTFGNWTFPAGTVFVKHFEIPVDARNPAVVKRLETRVMICTDGGGKYGLTYRWNEQGSDATLLAAGASESFGIISEDGSTVPMEWSYPSRADCMQCHTGAAGQALGLRTHQLNRDVLRPVTGERINQLVLMDEEKILETGATVSSGWADGRPRAAGLDDESVPIEHRVRSYLDSNCAHCHQPDGPVPFFDARLQTPLQAQNLINAAIQGRYHLPGGCYIKPGEPDLSAVNVRTGSAEPGVAMPPVGKHRVDGQAAALLREYVEGLTEEEFQTVPGPQARYVRFTATQVTGTVVAVADLSVLDGSGIGIPGNEIAVREFSSESEPGSSANVVDGNPGTCWVSQPDGSLPKSISLDLGKIREIGGFEYVPRQDSPVGRPSGYSVHYSLDGSTWSLMATRTLAVPIASVDRFTGFVGRRPVRVSLAGPGTTVAKDFTVTIVFDQAVTGFDPFDLMVTGGTVTSVRGSGHHYRASIAATGTDVEISLPAGRVNPGEFANRASEILHVRSALEVPPVPAFTALPRYQHSLEARLVFDKPVDGLSAEDFTVSGGRLERLIQDAGGWTLILSGQSGINNMDIQLRDGAVTGQSGLQSLAGIVSASRIFANFEREVENMFPSGFLRESDPSASSGRYLWVPEGQRGTRTDPDPAYSIYLTNTFAVPVEGAYRLRGWTRADDVQSNSFHVRLGSGTESLPWTTNTGKGEIGSGTFHAGFAGESVVPYQFLLPPGSTRLEIFAGEDGTRIDRVELVPVRPQPAWGRRVGSDTLSQAWALRFTSPVTGLDATDFEVHGGLVTGVAGSGRDYLVSAEASEERMLLRVKEHAVSDELGATSIASEWRVVRATSTFDDWAEDYRVANSPWYDLSDPDADGVGQLLEYALGLDPLTTDRGIVDPLDPGSRGLPWVGVAESPSGPRLRMVFHRRKSPASVRYAVEFSGDLVGFDRRTDFTGMTEPLDEQWERVTVIDTAAEAGAPARFGRLVVER